MSAIFGLFYLDGRQVESAHLAKMGEVLSHRGPDRWGRWHEGCVGLGHRMLFTTPQSVNEHLPTSNKAAHLTITADARIDNREELIGLLGLQRQPSSEIGDGELIMAAYEKWGKECPAKLLGDFAFVIWDSRKQSLFCARDHFGVKPFYYYHSKHLFVFASEIKAILSVPEIPRETNEVKIGEHLTSMVGEKVSTFYKDISGLPPSHSLFVDSGAVHLQEYWSLNPDIELHLRSDTEYEEAFREIFTEAVQCRLNSAFPVGSFLSGGLDSSSITCVASEIMRNNGRKRLSTFSAIFDEVTQCDERSYINAVLAKDPLDPHYVHGDQINPLAEIKRVSWHLDEPVSAGNLFINWNVYEAAKEIGVRVVLDGFDGDTTVSHGSGYLNELANAHRWLSLMEELRGFTRIHGLPFWKPLYFYLWNYCFKPQIPTKILHRASRLRQSLSKQKCSEPKPRWLIPLNNDFVHRTGLAERRQALSARRSETERQFHFFSLTLPGISHALELLDKCAAAFSIEPRYPFWDRRLVEFCLSLPAPQKIHKGLGRMIMRRALKGTLPAQIQTRTSKCNFTPNFNHTLFAFARKQIDEVLLRAPELLERYVNISVLRDAHARFTVRKASDDDNSLIWKCACLALWLTHEAEC